MSSRSFVEKFLEFYLSHVKTGIQDEQMGKGQAARIALGINIVYALVKK